MSEAEFSINIRVYYEDTDFGGVVYYANYLKFMERARTDFLRKQGLNQAVLLDTGRRMFVVRRAAIDYHSPARFDDLLSVTAVVAKVRRASVVFEQKCWRVKTTTGSEGVAAVIDNRESLLASATVLVACLDADTHKPCAIPGQLNMVMDR